MLAYIYIYTVYYTYDSKQKQLVYCKTKVNNRCLKYIFIF